MESKNQWFTPLREQKFRLTKNRRAILEVLGNNHLTFKELYDALKHRGHTNVASLYNNLDFLIEHKIITEVYINDTKYYDLALDNHKHNADSHMHLLQKDTHNIIEIDRPEIFEAIKKLPELKHYDVEFIRISIQAKTKK